MRRQGGCAQGPCAGPAWSWLGNSGEQQSPEDETLWLVPCLARMRFALYERYGMEPSQDARLTGTLDGAPECPWSAKSDHD